MASLIQFLAAGVKGAEGGECTITLRGTSTSAAAFLWNEFEEITQPGGNVFSLDSNGGLEIYTDTLVDVQVRDSETLVLRNLTVGHSAPVVEVESASFLGTDYDGSPANTAGQPTTLQAILDKWITSAGATDWKVDFNGSPTNISTALASFGTIFFNVTSPEFGALGDGVTDDTSAIAAAIAAADAVDGGIVFFPPGVYVVSLLTISSVNVVLMGSGAGASVLLGTDNTTHIVRFTDNTVAGSKRITGLELRSSNDYGSLVIIEENQNVAIDHCKLDGTNCNGSVVRRIDADGPTNIQVTACRLVVGNGATQCLLNESDDGETFFSVQGCRFEVEAGFTGSIIDGPDFNASGNEFDASAVISGAYYHINAESQETTGRYIGTFSGNVFYDGGSTGFAFKLENLSTLCDFSESGNTFSGFTAPATLDDAGHIYSLSVGATNFNNVVNLGSRKGRALKFLSVSLTDIPSLILASIVAETVIIEYDDAVEDAIDVQPTPNIPNGDSVILVLNETGNPLQVVFTASGFTGSENAIPDGGKAVGFFRSFVEEAGVEANVLFSSKQSST